MRSSEQGKVLWILLVGMSLLIGASWWYQDHQKTVRVREAALRTAQQAQAERVKLEKRLVLEKKQKDAYTQSLEAFDELVKRWEDAVRIADSTSRVSLAGPVAKIQEILRDAEKLTPPPCLDGGKKELLSSMTNTVKGFIEFMRNDANIGKELAQIYFKDVGPAFKSYQSARDTCPAP